MRTVPEHDLDRRARFSGLVDECADPVLRYLRRRTDASTADECLGDTLLVLWRRLDDVPADAPQAWAIGVARGCLANAVRAEGRRLRLVRRLAAEPPAPPPEGDPALFEALATLGELDREVVRLWAWEGLAPRESAVVLGLTPNAVSLRLSRSLARLRSQLGVRQDPASAGQEQGDEGGRHR